MADSSNVPTGPANVVAAQQSGKQRQLAVAIARDATRLEIATFRQQFLPANG